MDKWISAARHYSSLIANNPDNPAEAVILSAVALLAAVLILSWVGKGLGVAMPTAPRSSITVVFAGACLVATLAGAELLMDKLFPGAGTMTLRIMLGVACFAVLTALIVPAGCLLLKSGFSKTLAAILITAGGVAVSILLAKAIIRSIETGSNFMDKTRTNTEERSF